MPSGTLEHFVLAAWHKSCTAKSQRFARTPAVLTKLMLSRWSLARMKTGKARSPPIYINLKGQASCMAEGLSVPWFFAALQDLNIRYMMDLELFGNDPALQS